MLAGDSDSKRWRARVASQESAGVKESRCPGDSEAMRNDVEEVVNSQTNGGGDIELRRVDRGEKVRGEGNKDTIRKGTDGKRKAKVTLGMCST